MKKLFMNRKGADAFTLLLTAIAIMVLMFILIGLTMKYNKLENTIGGAGSNAAAILSAYDKTDESLLYLDNAAELSMQNATYLLAYEGFHSPNANPICGIHDTYRKWSIGHAVPAGGASCDATLDRCVPTGYDGFKRYFKGNLDSYIAAYNESGRVNLTAGNYDDLTLIDTGKELQVVGKAKTPIVLDTNRVHYEVMPSFRQNIDVDLISDFEEIAGPGEKLGKGEDLLNRIDELKGKIQNKEVLTESQLKDIFKDYSDESKELDWALESYDTQIDGDCNTGAECSIICCAGNPPSCWEVYGEWHQLYRNYDLDVDIKIVDDNYKLKGEKKGYKSFATSESGSPEKKDYTYRFALHWVTMTPQKYCDATCS